MNNTDAQRLEELKLKIWGTVAKQHLSGEKDPDVILQKQIENHKGRIDKALRLLGSYVSEGRTLRDTSMGYTHEETIHTVINLEDSKYLGKAREFISGVKELHDELFNKEFSTQFEFDTIGYVTIESLTNEQAIYVYWHKDEYQFAEGTISKTIISKETRLYPKALLDTRMKSIMRSIIEQYFHSNFHTKIEKLLKVPTGSIKHDDHFDLQIRNFSAHGHRFTMENYFGKNGFIDEYTHYHDYFEALIKSLNRFNSIIQQAGGHAALLESYRKEIIEHLIEVAPIHAFQPCKENRHFSKIPIKEQFECPFLSAFILKNASYLNYDLLYEEDKSILFIDEDNVCTKYGGSIEDTVFTPKQDELDLINENKKELTI